MGSVAPYTIGVMGSATEEHDQEARIVGAVLADLGVNLLTGGGPGVMRAVCRAYTRHPRRQGICIGIIPCASETDRVRPKEGYPNEFVELAIRTHLPYSGRKGTHDLSRNHINILTCDAVIALPGEQGTASEIALALRYRKPVRGYAGAEEPVVHFPASVPRLHSAEDLRQFVHEVIAVPRTASGL